MEHWLQTLAACVTALVIPAYGLWRLATRVAIVETRLLDQEKRGERHQSALEALTPQLATIQAKLEEIYRRLMREKE